MGCLSTFFESWRGPLFSCFSKDFPARVPSLFLFCKVKRGKSSCRCYRPDEWERFYCILVIWNFGDV
jgi:hypothetical protein